MYPTDECHFCKLKLSDKSSVYRICKNCKYDYRVWDDGVVTFFINKKQFNCSNQDKTVDVFDSYDLISLGWIIITEENINYVLEKIEKLKMFL